MFSTARISRNTLAEAIGALEAVAEAPRSTGWLRTECAAVAQQLRLERRLSVEAAHRERLHPLTGSERVWKDDAA